MNPKSMKTLSDTPAKPEHFEVDLGSPVTFPMEAFQRPRTPALMGAEMCLCEPDGINYSLHAPNCDVKLERDVDFGVVPGTKRPSLFKSGAEKVALAYGLLQHYTVENSIEQFSDEPFCFYRVRCDLHNICFLSVRFTALLPHARRARALPETDGDILLQARHPSNIFRSHTPQEPPLRPRTQTDV